jgi:diguanylate cyclase (GGDEF)-like protein
MAARRPSHFTSRLLRGLNQPAGRRSVDRDGEGYTDEVPSEELDFYANDDLGEPTIERRINRKKVAGRLFYPVVRIAAGPDLGGFVNLALKDEVLIGRDPKADLQLSDPGVSRQHARVKWREDGRFEVRDLGSTNGVEIGGVPVLHTVVEPGTRVDIVNVSLMLELLEAPQIDHLKRVTLKLQLAEGRDPLTGLYMRTYMDDRLPELVTTARGTGHFLCCLFLDIDHFKKVNDRFGHQVGDEVLRQAAHIVVQACRQEDQWVRYGGEEFLAFMPGTDEETAWAAAERLRVAFLAYDWSRTHPDLRVTISLGLARLRPSEPLESWIGRADQALYLAKRLGRNRVERAD